jgi:hypothetical protein
MKTIKGLPEQVHLSNYAHLNIKNINKIRDDTENGVFGKANGLWVSSYSKYRANTTGELSPWFVYTLYKISAGLGAKPFITHSKYAYLLEISDRARLLEVEPKYEKEFLKKYAKHSFAKDYNINWKQLKEEYDGVHFRLKHNHFNFENFNTYPLYNIATESSVLFRPVVINIEKIKNYNPLQIVLNMYHDIYAQTHEHYAFILKGAYTYLKQYYKN